MAWVTITTASIQSAISKAEYDKFTTTSTGSLSPATLVTNTISDVTNMIRGFVAGNPRNQLDLDETTIPAVLSYVAITLIVYRLEQRIAGNVIDIKETRQKDYDNAMKILFDVASGAFGIDIPANPRTLSQYYPFVGSSDTPIVN